MVNSPKHCPSPRTTIDKTFAYTQYYRGERDNEDRRSDEGCNHWSGPEVVLLSSPHLFQLFVLRIRLN